MAAESTTSTPQPASVQTANNTSWFKQHEKLIIIFMSLILAYFTIDKGFALWSQYETHQALLANTALTTQKAQTDQEIQQAKTQLQDYEAALAASIQQNSALANAIASRDKTVIVQQQKDATLPPTQLATRWQGLVNNTGVTASTSGYVVTDDAAVNTVQLLEQIPVLKQDLTDETTKATGLQTDVTDANTLIASGKVAYNGLQEELQDQNKSCSAQVSALQAAAKKQKIADVWAKVKWTAAGFAAGFITGVLK